MKSEISIIPTSVFKRNVKKLKKKSPHIGEDLKRLGQHLDQDPSYGIYLGAGIYKIRLKNSDQPKGKKGAYRVITFYSPKESCLYLLTIYHKSQIENIPIHKIIEILKIEGLV